MGSIRLGSEMPHKSIAYREMRSLISRCRLSIIIKCFYLTSLRDWAYVKVGTEMERPVVCN